jgi:hypothetical protein
MIPKNTFVIVTHRMLYKDNQRSVSEACSWGSSVNIGSDYRLDERDSVLGRGKGFFL